MHHWLAFLRLFSAGQSLRREGLESQPFDPATARMAGCTSGRSECPAGTATLMPYRACITIGRWPGGARAASGGGPSGAAVQCPARGWPEQVPPSVLLLVASGQVVPDQVTPVEVGGPVHGGACQVRAGQGGAVEVGAGQVGPGQLGAGQLRLDRLHPASCAQGVLVTWLTALCSRRGSDSGALASFRWQKRSAGLPSEAGYGQVRVLLGPTAGGYRYRIRNAAADLGLPHVCGSPGARLTMPGARVNGMF